MHESKDLGGLQRSGVKIGNNIKADVYEKKSGLVNP